MAYCNLNLNDQIIRISTDGYGDETGGTECFEANVYEMFQSLVAVSERTGRHALSLNSRITDGEPEEDLGIGRLNCVR